MVGASLYIIRCSARNRLRARLNRLREPRYLVGALVGASYLYFSVFARLRSPGSDRRRRARGGPPVEVGLATLGAAGPSLASLVLLAMAAVGWLLPFDSGLLDFSKAEVQFLFPAPVSRRALLTHRMLRSQLGMLFGSIVFSLVTPSTSGYARLRIGVAMWLLLSVGKVYFTGISLARARLGSPAAGVRRAARLPLAVLLAAVGIVSAALIRAFAAAPAAGVREALGRIADATGGGVAGLVLWPFRTLASPLFAAWPGPYLLSLFGASLVLAAAGVWVLRSDETFQDAAEQAAIRADAAASKALPAYRARASGWPLAPGGRPEMVFAWKAATQTVRLVDRRSLFRMAAILAALAIAAASVGRSSGLAGAVGAFSMAGVVFFLMLGPQAIRIDLRQDLQHLELLKTWPVSASAVVRGQIIWPGVLISAVSWLLILSAVYFTPAILPTVGLATRLGVGGAALLAVPALAFAQLAIHNGAALVFPAWVPLGSQRARGLDAMGQRIIMLGGAWLALIVMTLPGAVGGAVVWLFLRGLLGPLALVPGAMVVAVALFAEVLMMTELIAPAYDRLDLLAVERSE